MRCILIAAALLLATAASAVVVDVVCPDGTRYIGDGVPPCAISCPGGKWVMPGERCASAAQSRTEAPVTPTPRPLNSTDWIGALGGAALIALLLAGVASQRRRWREPMFCRRCEDRVEPVRVTPGSGWIELLLWLLFLVPGLLYSVWRLTARHRGCPNCGSADLVPLGSTIARRMLAGRD